MEDYLKDSYAEDRKESGAMKILRKLEERL